MRKTILGIIKSWSGSESIIMPGSKNKKIRNEKETIYTYIQGQKPQDGFTPFGPKIYSSLMEYSCATGQNRFKSFVLLFLFGD